MRKVNYILPFVVLTCTLAIFGCKNKKLEVSEKRTSAVAESKKDTTSKTEPSAETVTEKTETTAAQSADAPSGSGSATSALKTKNETYTNANVTITYPALTDLKDAAKQEQINKQLAKNITSVTEAMKIDPASTKLEIGSKVIGYDGTRLSIAYQGTLKNADGTTKNIFFTNTIDTATGKDLGLSDFTDPEIMAAYILSDDVKLSGASEDVTRRFMETRFNRNIDEYIAILTGADFPLDTDAEGKIVGFPQSFSYENNGDIYFTIPVAHDLGDYITIVYSPDTK